MLVYRWYIGCKNSKEIFFSKVSGSKGKRKAHKHFRFLSLICHVTLDVLKSSGMPLSRQLNFSLNISFNSRLNGQKEVNSECLMCTSAAEMLTVV